MKLYTGYFAQVEKYRAAGLILISIAQILPEWLKDKGIIEAHVLAPQLEWLEFKTDKAKFQPLYKEYLETLSAGEILRRFHKAAKGKDAVMLCYESWNECQAGRSFCHRHLLAEWLTKKVGIKIDEFIIDGPRGKKIVKTEAPKLF